MTRYVGVDPGSSGGIAVLDEGFIEPRTLKLKDATEAEIACFLRELAGDAVCVIEKVSATPQMGVTSAFSFGQSYGILRGCIAGAGIPIAYVSPVKWQNALNCRTGGDKNRSKAAAQNLFPTLKITHAIADALLLATYAKFNARDLFPQAQEASR